jgi:hypothetical protein
MRGDWIEGFIEFTEGLSSPPLFRKWGAISALAGALERKVWVRTMGSNVYPNMFVLLVAPPGVGKTEITWRVRALWEGLEDHHLASSSVTKASLIDELAAATRRWVILKPVPGENPVDSFNSLLMCINELGVLLPAYENEFMNTLTDLWDGKGYSERRRTSKIEHNIKKPQLSLLAACTPSYLVHVLPEGAWDQGFLSRTMLIYSGDRQLRSLFAENEFDKGAWDKLARGLESMAALYGEMKWTADAAQLIDAFHMRDGAPKPDHPKLMSYNIRRTVHLLKLCIVASVSRSDELLITDEDFHRALDWLTEAEVTMPDIFKAMTQGGAGKTMEEAWHFIFTTHARENKPVMKHRLIQFLQERVPVHTIETTIKMMEEGNMIEPILVATGKAYKPRGRRGPQ